MQEQNLAEHISSSSPLSIITTEYTKSAITQVPFVPQYIEAIPKEDKNFISPSSIFELQNNTITQPRLNEDIESVGSFNEHSEQFKSPVHRPSTSQQQVQVLISQTSQSNFIEPPTQSSRKKMPWQNRPILSKRQIHNQSNFLWPSDMSPQTTLSDWQDKIMFKNKGRKSTTDPKMTEVNSNKRQMRPFSSFISGHDQSEAQQSSQDIELHQQGQKIDPIGRMTSPRPQLQQNRRLQASLLAAQFKQEKIQTRKAIETNRVRHKESLKAKIKLVKQKKQSWTAKKSNEISPVCMEAGAKDSTFAARTLKLDKAHTNSKYMQQQTKQVKKEHQIPTVSSKLLSSTQDNFTSHAHLAISDQLTTLEKYQTQRQMTKEKYKSERMAGFTSRNRQLSSRNLFETPKLSGRLRPMTESGMTVKTLQRQLSPKSSLHMEQQSQISPRGSQQQKSPQSHQQQHLNIPNSISVFDLQHRQVIKKLSQTRSQFLQSSKFFGGPTHQQIKLSGNNMQAKNLTKVKNTKQNRPKSNFREHLRTLSCEYLPTGGFTGQYTYEARQKLTEKTRRESDLVGTPQVVVEMPTVQARPTTPEVEYLLQNTQTEKQDTASDCFKSDESIRENTVTSVAGPAHAHSLEDYLKYDDGSSVDNIHKLFELLRDNENKFEVEGVQYQLDVNRKEIDEMMRVYKQFSQQSQVDASRQGDVTSPSYMELQQQKSEFLNSISGRFNLRALQAKVNGEDERNKSTDHKAAIRNIFTKMKPHTKIKDVNQTNKTATGQAIKKDGIPVTQDNTRKVSFLQRLANQRTEVTQTSQVPKQLSLLLMDRKGIVEPVIEAPPEKEFEVMPQRPLTREELCKTMQSSSSVKMNNHRERSKKAGPKVNIAYLFASPLVFTDFDSASKMQGKQIMPQLNFLGEIKSIKSSLKESNKQIVFKSLLATEQHLREVLKKGPRVLHLTCHGLFIQPKIQVGCTEEEKNFLLFETDRGRNDLISLAQFKRIIKQELGPSYHLDLILLNGCNPEFNAKFALNTGAKHVICIKTLQESHYETATTIFIEKLYENLARGKTVCDSFNDAVTEIWLTLLHEMQQSQLSKIFKLYTAEQIIELDPLEFRDPKPHTCKENRLPAKQDMYICMSDHTQIKYMPTKETGIKFREKEIWDLVQKVMRGEKLVAIIGPHGIGKSSIVKAALHYIAERKFFTGSMIQVQVKSIKDCFSLLRKIQRLVFNSFEIDIETIRVLNENTCSRKSITELLIGVFNEYIIYDYKVEKHQNISERQYLICLDNCEDLIDKSWKKLQLLLRRLTDECPNLSIIFTSHRAIDTEHIEQMPNPPEIQYIKQLSHTEIVQLFDELTVDAPKSIKMEDVYDVILRDTDYPIQKIMPTYAHERIQKPINQKFKEGLRELLKSREEQMKALRHHELFQSVQGNPTSIRFLAACYSNQVKPKSLIDLYQRVLHEKSLVTVIDKKNDGKLDKQDKDTELPQISKNNFSLNFSTEAVLSVLEQSHPQVLNLFYFLGCLPGGLHLNQLNEIWADTDNSLKVLREMSFLEGNNSKIVLKTHLIKYFDLSFDPKCKNNYITQLSEYYITILVRVFTEQDNMTNLKFQMRNIEHCLHHFIKIAELNRKNVYNQIGRVEQQNNFVSWNSTARETLIKKNFKVLVRKDRVIRKRGTNPIDSSDSSAIASSLAELSSDGDLSYRLPNIESSMKKAAHEAELEMNKKSSIKRMITLKKNKEVKFNTENSPAKELFPNVSKILMTGKSSQEEAPFQNHQLPAFDEQNTNPHKKISRVDLSCIGAKRVITLSDTDSSEQSEVEQKEVNLKKKSASNPVPVKKEAIIKIEKMNIDGLSDISSVLIDQSSITNSEAEEDHDEKKVQLAFIGGKYTEERAVERENVMRKVKSELPIKKKVVEQQQFIASTPQDDLRGFPSANLKSLKTNCWKGMEKYNEQSNYTITRNQTIKVDNKRIGQLKTAKSLIPQKKTSSKTLMKMIRNSNKNDRINIAGQFVLLTAINMFLSGDFMYCHRICNRNFTYVVNNPLFEGNFYRLKALSAEQLFIHQKEEKESGIQLLFLAIESLQQSLSFFGVKKKGLSEQTVDKRTVKQSERNPYGIALLEFQLGCIYEKHGEVLSSEDALQYVEDFESSVLESVQKLVKSGEDAFRKASVDHFKEAYKHFKEVNHLKGKHVAKLHELNVVSCGIDLNDSEKLRMEIERHESKDYEQNIIKWKKLQSKVAKLELNYETYLSEFGKDQCVFINRKQGSDVSILSEIVYQNSGFELFPTNKDQLNEPKLTKKQTMTSRMNKNNNIS